MSDNWIRVNEIVEYVYCQRAWWLRRVRGHSSQNVKMLASGTAYHQTHGRRVGWSIRLRRLGAGLLVVGLLALLLALLGA